MKHRIFGRQFKRTVNERKALFRTLLESLFLHEQIKTTEAKAKAIRAEADKLIIKAKAQDLNARRQLLAVLSSEAVKRLIEEIGPRFSGRSSGFTRIIKLGPRKGDSAPMSLMQLIKEEKIEEKTLPKTTKEIKSGRKAQRSVKVQRRKTARKVGK